MEDCYDHCFTKNHFDMDKSDEDFKNRIVYKYCPLEKKRIPVLIASLRY